VRRTEQLATELGADWYVRADADEFRLSPWPGLSHAEAITLVDAMGFNAVQSRVLEFRPTDDSFKGGDPREHLHHYEPPDFSNTLWIKAWKQPPAGTPVAIADSGGHEAAFAGRRICPVNFISQHFPMRSAEHARRKIFKERLARYPKQEREMGWHTHWDELADSEHSFLWDPATLSRWDQATVQAEVLTRASIDMILAGRMHNVDVSARPPVGPDPLQYVSHAFGEPRSLTPESLDMLSEAAMALVRHAIMDRDFDAPEDPVVVRAMLVLIELWIADRRTRGDFHGANLLEKARAMLIERATAAGTLETPGSDPGVSQASAPARLPGRNEACWCGSGEKFKRCHGPAQAAA
jgi:hypothetical protein